MSTIYIAGPMTGIEDDNRPAFNVAAEHLRGQGFEVTNPAEQPRDNARAFYMHEALYALRACKVVYLLPGWENSEGARLEVGVASELCRPFMLHIGAKAPTEGMKLELLLKDRRAE